MAKDRKKGCCSPARDQSGNVAPGVVIARPADVPFFPQPTAQIPGGKAYLGTKTPFFPVDEEGPLRRKTVKPFQITTTTITNANFARFVEETGFVTEAERFGWSFVFHTDVPEGLETQGVVGVEWWRRVDGAYWRDIHGPGSADAWLPDHPVTHVSWNDAQAFARWCGGRLPTEAEWEHAARGGLGDVPFPWGTEEPNDDSYLPCNIWQGRFPYMNTQADGWGGTAPAQSFEPNGHGLFNVVGNVWEWTADALRVRSLKKEQRQKAQAVRGHKVLKGGSFLCHRSYCFRYRIPARIGNSPDTTTPHQGFRVVWDIRSQIT